MANLAAGRSCVVFHQNKNANVNLKFSVRGDGTIRKSHVRDAKFGRERIVRRLARRENRTEYQLNLESRYINVLSVFIKLDSLHSLLPKGFISRQ
jgi:hypothetical protein